MLKSSQDSSVARPHYFDAEGLINDLYVIVQIGSISSPLRQVNNFRGDFIAFVVSITNLSEGKEKDQLQMRPLPCRARKDLHSRPPMKIASNY